MRTTTNRLILTLGLCFYACVFAQSPITLESVQAIARGESPSSRQAGYTQQAARADYHAFRAGLKPQIRLRADIPGFNRSIEAISQDDGNTLFRTLNQTFSSANLSLTQVLPFSGGRFTAFSSLSNFNSFGTTGFTTWQSVPVGFSFSQPIFQVNPFKWERQAQDLRVTLADLRYIQSQEEAVVQATQLYFTALIAQLNLIRARQNVSNNDTIYTLSKGRYSVGRIAENELLQSELSLVNARADSSQAALEYAQAMQRLRTFLGGSLPGEELVRPLAPPTLDIAPSEAVALAQEYSDLMPQQALERLQAERTVREAKARNRFSLDLNASFGFNQSGDSLREAYQNLQDQEAFSIGISVPILQWGQGKAEVEAAYARQQATQIGLALDQQQYADDIYYRVQNVAQLHTQLRIAARADTVATRRYEISKGRYLIGKISIQDLFIAQSEKDNAQQNYVQTLRSLYLAHYGLRVETLYDFVEGVPLWTR